MRSMPGGYKQWPRNYAQGALKLLAYSLVVTAAAMTVIAAAMRIPPQALKTNVPAFFVYTLVIGGLSWAIVPIWGKRTEHYHPLLRWTILTGVLLATGTLGSAIASGFALYAFRLEGTLVSLFRDSLVTALPVTCVVGVLSTVIQAGRERLKTSELAVQTQRLERERAEKLAAEARLASLSSRVQPHFLFNTLNSISALIREHPVQAEQMIGRLSSLLRCSLNPVEAVTLEQEVDLVRHYLEIQGIRMGERLSFQIDVDPGLPVKVPPFSIQTLVENSLKHVGEKRQQGVKLRIRAELLHGETVICVTDDGPGFDPDSIRAGGGLDNLQARLQAVCSESATLEFLREQGRMSVRMRVPAA